MDELNLTDEQLAVVENTKESVYVKSSPGSGKTVTIVEKIAYIIENKLCEPKDILCITFTSKAAEELNQRLRKRLKDASLNLKAQTFHSYALSLLKRYSSVSGFKETSMIISDNDINSFFSNMEIQSIKEITTFIERVKELAKDDMPNFDLAYNPRFSFSKDEMIVFYQQYEDKKTKVHAYDFSDICLNAHIMLKNNPDISRKEQKYKFIMLDEAQDTNSVQLMLLCDILGEKTKINAFGDPNQAIYRWRGAVPQDVDSFMQKIKACEMNLTRTHRCTSQICNASASLMGKLSKESFKEVMNNDFKEGSKPRLYGFQTRNEELNAIVLEVTKALEERKLENKDIVVQARTNEEVKEILGFLKEKGIEASSLLQPNPYNSNEMDLYFSFINVATNTQDMAALMKVCKYIGLGDEENKLIQTGYKFKDIFHFVQKQKSQLSEKVNACREVLLNAYEAQKEGKKDLSYITKLFFSSFLPLGEKNGLESKVENEIQLLSTLNTEQAFERFLRLHNEKYIDTQSNTVKVTTEHGTKGLEWKMSIVTGLSDAKIEKNAYKAVNLEEERNLLFVAMTRAKEHLVLTYNTQKTENAAVGPSQLLLDIGRECLDIQHSDDVIPSKLIENINITDRVVQNRLSFIRNETSQIKFVPRNHFVYEDEIEKSAPQRKKVMQFAQP